MAVWTVISGTARVPKVIPVGLRELINTRFGNADCVIDSVNDTPELETESSRMFVFSFRFENGGMAAVGMIKNFTSDLDWFGINHDFTASIRFLGSK